LDGRHRNVEPGWVPRHSGHSGIELGSEGAYPKSGRGGSRHPVVLEMLAASRRPGASGKGAPAAARRTQLARHV
jgi:hypothetical protein